MSSKVNIGLDAGSTTVKIVATDSKNKIIFKAYERHIADVAGTIIAAFEKLQKEI